MTDDKAKAHKLEVGSIVSARTRRGLVELTIDGVSMQLELSKAREIVGMLQGAIEAAISDQLLFEFLTTKVGISLEAAGAALLDFRELRQGTRETQWES